MKRFRIWRTTLALVTVLGICAIVGAAADQKPTDEKPTDAALVNGQGIPYQDFEWELELYHRRLQSQGVQVPEHLQVQLRQEVIDEMISRELIFQESVKKGIRIPSEQVESELAAIKQRYPDQSTFEDTLANMKMTENRLKHQIARGSAINAFVQKEIISKIEITDADVKSFYEGNTSMFERPEEVRAQHILIKVARDADQEQKDEARKTLGDIKKKADAGEDFADLARANSQCPSAQNGGDLGYFAKGTMVPAFETAAFELAPETVSDIVVTDFGYHLIKVLERRAAGKIELAEATPKIEENLRNEQFQTLLTKFLEDLRRDATIETFIW